MTNKKKTSAEEMRANITQVGVGNGSGDFMDIVQAITEEPAKVKTALFVCEMRPNAKIKVNGKTYDQQGYVGGLRLFNDPEKTESIVYAVGVALGVALVEKFRKQERYDLINNVCQGMASKFMEGIVSTLDDTDMEYVSKVLGASIFKLGDEEKE